MKTNQHRKTMKMDETDYISALPESILYHILSFVDTKTAVRTAILSTRWIRVWTSLPVLDFRFDSSYQRTARKPKLFQHGISHVLANRDDSHLLKVRLRLHGIVSPSLIEDCLIYAADHKVKDLRICAFTNILPVCLPAHLLSSQYLEALKLKCVARDNISLPTSWSFPNLKYLKLKNFIFCDKNFDNGKIFSGCPKLEILSLCKCAIKHEDKLKELELNCPELKVLEIVIWRSPWAYYGVQSINVAAPKLSSFVFIGPVAKVCFKEELSCLDRVFVDLSYPKYCASEDRKTWTGECFMTMLGQFSSARFLSLSMDTIEALSVVRGIREYGPFTFGNLRHIKFITNDECSSVTMPIDAVTDILKSTADGYLVFKGDKLSTRGKPSHSRNAKNDKNIAIHVMSYLLEMAPCVEFLTVEKLRQPVMKVEYNSWKNSR